MPEDVPLVPQPMTSPADTQPVPDTDAWDRMNPWAGRIIVGVCVLSVVIAGFDERPLTTTLPCGIALTLATWLAVLSLDRSAVADDRTETDTPAPRRTSSAA